MWFSWWTKAVQWRWKKNCSIFTTQIADKTTNTHFRALFYWSGAVRWKSLWKYCNKKNFSSITLWMIHSLDHFQSRKPFFSIHSYNFYLNYCINGRYGCECVTCHKLYFHKFIEIKRKPMCFWCVVIICIKEPEREHLWEWRWIRYSNAWYWHKYRGSLPYRIKRFPFSFLLCLLWFEFLICSPILMGPISIHNSFRFITSAFEMNYHFFSLSYFRMKISCFFFSIQIKYIFFFFIYSKNKRN